jgi:hypothetical protein
MAPAIAAKAGKEESLGTGAGPQIVRPTDRIVIPDDMRIVTEEGPKDHLSSELEVWRVSGGELVLKVWQAMLESGDLTTATLEDGSFAAEIDSLDPWTRYAIRARHGTAKGFTEWGPEFLIRTDNGSEEVFNPAIIGEVWLDIPKSSWMPIDDVALTGCEPHPRSYYPGAVKIGATDFPGSGVRIKGGCGSSRTLDDKAAFKANMSWDDPAVDGCPETRRYKGLKKITLNNQVEDASYTHERIGYDFFQKLGIPVPRAAPVRVYVNNQLWGLYLHVETIDRRFLARHFDSNDGMLYEADYGCDIGEESCFEEKFDTDSCDDPPEGDPTDMTPLRGLNARLAQMPSDNFYPAIDQIIDFDAYLTTWAAASIMGFWDGYPNDPNNYRLYHDPSDDRWTLIPTGIDQLFEENVDPFNPVGMLSKRCLAEEDCRAAFSSKLTELIDVFEVSDYPAMARTFETQIRAEVEADPRKEVSVSEWHAAVNSTVLYMQRRPGELRDVLSRPDQKRSGQDFHFHALTDPEGERFIFVTWVVPGDDTASGQQWMSAKGYFEGLRAEMDALELIGGSADGVKIGTVTVSFVDGNTAAFHYSPDDDGLEGQTKIARIDSGIWKYCE